LEEVICLTAQSADILAEKLVTVECDSVSAVEQYQDVLDTMCDLVGKVERRAKKKQ
jgi:hypothetical protein